MGIVDQNGCKIDNPKWNRYERWLISRYFPKSEGYEKKWKVTEPLDTRGGDCVDVKYFKTHAEALEYANREYFRAWLLREIENFFDDDANLADFRYIMKAILEMPLIWPSVRELT